MGLEEGMGGGGVRRWRGTAVVVVWVVWALVDGVQGLRLENGFTLSNKQKYDLLEPEGAQRVFGFEEGGVAEVNVSLNGASDSRLIVAACQTPAARRNTKFILSWRPQASSAAWTSIGRELCSSGAATNVTCYSAPLEFNDSTEATARVYVQSRAIYEMVVFSCSNQEGSISGGYTAHFTNPDSLPELGWEERYFPVTSTVYSAVFGLMLAYMVGSWLVLHRRTAMHVLALSLTAALVCKVAANAFFAAGWWLLAETGYETGALLFLRSVFAVLAELIVVGVILGIVSGFGILDEEFLRIDQRSRHARFRVMLAVGMNVISSAAFHMLGARVFIAGVIKACSDALTLTIIFYVSRQQSKTLRSYNEVIERYGYKPESTPFFWREFAVQWLPWIYLVKCFISALFVVLCDWAAVLPPIVLYNALELPELPMYFALVVILGRRRHSPFTSKLEYDRAEIDLRLEHDEDDGDRTQDLRTWKWGDSLPTMQQTWRLAYEKELIKVSKEKGEKPYCLVVEDPLEPGHTRPILHLALPRLEAASFAAKKLQPEPEGPQEPEETVETAQAEEMEEV